METSGGPCGGALQGRGNPALPRGARGPAAHNDVGKSRTIEISYLHIKIMPKPQAFRDHTPILPTQSPVPWSRVGSRPAKVAPEKARVRDETPRGCAPSTRSSPENPGTHQSSHRPHRGRWEANPQDYPPDAWTRPGRAPDTGDEARRARSMGNTRPQEGHGRKRRCPLPGARGPTRSTISHHIFPVPTPRGQSPIGSMGLPSGSPARERPRRTIRRPCGGCFFSWVFGGYRWCSPGLKNLHREHPRLSGT